MMLPISSSLSSSIREQVFTILFPCNPPCIILVFLGSGENDDRPCFNMNQVVWICAKILKQREDHIRGEYEKVLQSKLQEQYETFIRFTQDELHRKFREGTPSYVS